MVSALLIAGILSVLAGLLAIAYGASVQAFSLGNTLIVAGATAASTGMLLIGIWVVVGELRNIARRLTPRTSLDSRDRLGLPPPGASPRPAEGGFLFSRDEPVDADELETAGPPVSPQSWQADAAPRDRPRLGLPPLPEPAAEPAPPPRSGRDRLLSTPRRERDRTPPRAYEPLGSEANAGEATEVASVNFENAWPKPERARASEAQSPRRSGRASPRFADSASDDRSASTIIKSGVVDGMAYSLYSDGSIEAQMPEGMMRFGSIDELRAHLGQR
jgi:hypothetical protein